ncbi:hypothetical protein PAPYR_3482 [Paratrimastix pyriformis]|uniref:Uncharacterized protein n=1 Tax=Paratrimastix pyriformis TaxID=342808 RepID=A0ABQ8UQW7_9EUKA|nr:hypothetical protein PAPYR_3482 [Paratrimastix pyriformis]
MHTQQRPPSSFPIEGVLPSPKLSGRRHLVAMTPGTRSLRSFSPPVMAHRSRFPLLRTSSPPPRSKPAFDTSPSPIPVYNALLDPGCASFFMGSAYLRDQLAETDTLFMREAVSEVQREAQARGLARPAMTPHMHHSAPSASTVRSASVLPRLLAPLPPPLVPHCDAPPKPVPSHLRSSVPEFLHSPPKASHPSPTRPSREVTLFGPEERPHLRHHADLGWGGNARLLEKHCLAHPAHRQLGEAQTFIKSVQVPVLDPVRLRPFL